MEFRTIVEILKPDFEIDPCEPILFVGSCFATEISEHFRQEGFPVVVNPNGTMYNPASVLHTVERYEGKARTAFITLGTNHVYRLKETGEIVDNCEKRPQTLFQEEELSVEECIDYLSQAVDVLRKNNPDIHVVFTVSPIRYRKYGYHESQLSKSTLLLAVNQLIAHYSLLSTSLYYFPAYEIVMDELRDYRFYASDMLHPSQQAIDYIWERLVDTFFSKSAKLYLSEWRPLKQALAHKPFHPDSEEYRIHMDKTMLKVAEIRKKYPTFAL